MIDFVLDEEDNNVDMPFEEGAVVPVARFLTELESVSLEEMDAIFEKVYERGGKVDISNLILEHGSRQTEKRLELEKGFVKGKVLLRDLDANDPLRLFVQEIRYKKTAKIDENKLKNGDDKTMGAVAENYLPMVFEIAKEYAGKGVLLMDLIQEGSLGLWEAVSSWTEEPLESHLKTGIEKTIVHAIVSQAKEAGVGSMVKKYMELFKKSDFKLLHELGRNPTVSEIAVDLKISEEFAETVDKMIKDANAEAKNEVPETKAEEEDLDVDATAYYQSRQRVLDMLSSLDPLDARLISLRFGLESGKAVEIEEAAEVLGIDVEEARKREMNAILLLRNQEGNE